MAEDKRHEQDAAHEEAFVEVERLSTHSFVSYEGKITPSSSNVVPEPKSSFESSRCASAISPQSSVLDIQLIVEAEPDDKIGVESVVVKNAKKEMEEIYEQRKKDAWEERKREIGITNTDELISDMAARLRQDLSQGRARCCLGFLDTSTLRIEELAKTLSDAEELMATLNKGQKQQQHKSDAPAVGAAGGHGGGGGGGGSGWWLTYLVAAARAVLGLRRTLRDFDLQGTAELLADAVAKVLHPDAAEEVREVAVFLEQKRELYAAAARLVQYALAGQDDAYDLWEQAARQAGLARSGDLYLPLCLQFARACRRGRAALAARCARAARRADRPSLARLLAQARVMRADPATVAAAAADLARLRELEDGLLGRRRASSPPGGGCGRRRRGRGGGGSGGGGGGGGGGGRAAGACLGRGQGAVSAA